MYIHVHKSFVEFVEKNIRDISDTMQTDEKILATEDLELQLHKQHMAELEAAGGVSALPDISEFQMPESAMPHELTRLRAASGVSTQSSELSDSMEVGHCLLKSLWVVLNV